MLLMMQSNVLKRWLQEYRLCTKSYLADGKDGYDVFKSCEQLVMFNTNLSLISVMIFILCIDCHNGALWYLCQFCFVNTV